MTRHLAIAAISAAALAGPGAAHAADPGSWIKTSQLTKPAYYRQGIASNASGNDVFFAGSFEGVYRTRAGNAEVAANAHVIPKDVTQTEQFNHIGDIAFDPSSGGRLLLPLESYQPFQPDSNPSKTGAVGVVDPKTLQWQYYVKLDPAEIAKAMLFAVDPQGLLWTLAGRDLLAYNLADIRPGSGPIHSVKRLVGVAPDSVGGAVVFGNRIFVSTQAADVNRVVSIDLNTGASRTEIEIPGALEPEGMDVGPYLGGLLHWELVPGGGLSNTQVLNFVPKGARLSLRLSHTRFKAGKKTRLIATADLATNGTRIPLEGIEVRLAGRRAKTNAAGKASLSVKLTRGSYRAQAFYKGLRTATKRVRVT